MLLEQEIASIMAFALHYADNPSPYYYDVPENFRYPAMYFPQPEIDTGGETMRTYAMRYSWYINIFCATTEDAFALAWKVLTALKKKRNLVPLLNEDGSRAKGWLRLNDPSAKVIDTGVAQLTLSWTSRRPYDCDDVQKMVVWEVNGWKHADIYNSVDVETVLKNVVRNCVSDYPMPDYAGEKP